MEILAIDANGGVVPHARALVTQLQEGAPILRGQLDDAGLWELCVPSAPVFVLAYKTGIGLGCYHGATADRITVRLEPFIPLYFQSATAPTHKFIAMLRVQYECAGAVVSLNPFAARDEGWRYIDAVNGGLSVPVEIKECQFTAEVSPGIWRGMIPRSAHRVEVLVNVEPNVAGPKKGGDL